MSLFHRHCQPPRTPLDALEFEFRAFVDENKRGNVIARFLFGLSSYLPSRAIDSLPMMKS